jgi:hypothetical protein
MTLFAMLEVQRRGGRTRMKGERTEGGLSEKISILISAEGSTAGHGLSLP